MLDSVIAFKGQKYAALKRRAVLSGQPFQDPEFPPSERSLFHTPGKIQGIQWKRPSEICEKPKLFVDGVNQSDLIQGELGNCWLVAASSCLTVHKFLWSKVIADHVEQDWGSNFHAGIFHFRFWRFGVWTDVVIDDYLPTINGQLAFCHSLSRDEFWSALLEKAYAKLYGCYEALDGGELSEALEDFTGGVAETFDILSEKYLQDDEKRAGFFDWVSTSVDSGSLLCVAIPAKSKDEMEQRADYGLIKGHAYAITAVRKVRLAGTGVLGLFRHDTLAMVRLRNPWGPGSEWTGPFSDKSPEWQRIVKGDRDKIGLTFDDDGDFWMMFDDFCKYFENLAVCHRVNTSTLSLGKTWSEAMLNGEWALPHRVGGCINNKATYLNNPQFLVEVSKEDEVMIELTQKMQRLPGRERETIGFTILQVEENRSFRLHVPTMPVIQSSTFRNSRSVLVRRVLPKGRYVVVACTFDQGVIGAFLLRAYTGGSTRIRELVLDRPEESACSCLPGLGSPVCVTQIQVVRADGLQRVDGSRDVDAFCEISCEGKTVKTPIIKQSMKPEWNYYALFYRKNPLQKPIRVDVWHYSTLGFNEYLGGQAYIAASDVFGQQVELPLLGADEVIRPGRLLVAVTTSHNLAAV